MNFSQLTIVLLATIALQITAAVSFELLDGWQPEAVVEVPEGAVKAVDGLRRAQELEQDLSAAGSGDADTTATETELPATIMVLLPDFLAPSYSGSGSVMYFDGSVGDEDESASQGSDGGSTESSVAKSLHSPLDSGFSSGVALTTSVVILALGTLA